MSVGGGFSAYALERLSKDPQFILYRAREPASRRRVLLFAPASENLPQHILKRIEHEYALRAELDSAWAAMPIALAHDGGRTILVRKDPGGEPLDQLLERPFDLRQFLRIAIGLTTALAAMHERRIVHRDIRPANILVNAASGKVWLTGFGVATGPLRQPQAPEPSATVGATLAYMAPEQTGRMNRSIDTRSDLYSLGVTLYQMLTGTLPFVASDPLEWVHCHIARQPASPHERRKEVPEALSAIVLKLLAKSPEERYETAAGLRADLASCLKALNAVGHVEPFVLGRADVSDRLAVPEKLYGRDRERAILVEAFDRVVASGTPEFVLVSGYSGIGKSSIVNELQRAIVPTHGIFVSGKLDQYKREIPYATFAQAFQSLIRQVLSCATVEFEMWRDALIGALQTNGQLLINLVPELELVIGKQRSVPELTAHEAENRFHLLVRAFIGVFARPDHPLVLFLDDLQWLDPATLKLLEHLIVQVEVPHLLLVGAYRDNEVNASHPLALMLDALRGSKARLVKIELSPLSLDDLGRLVADTVHQEPALTESLARLVHEKTAGSPLFVAQFLTALAEERLLEFDPSIATWRWDVDRIRAHRSTDNVVDLMLGKLNRLPDNTREVLKKLACLGNRANAATLAVVQGRSEEETHSGVSEAVRQGFVILSGDSYEFVHDRVQEAAYSLIPEEDRAHVHLQIGRLLIAATPADKIAERIFNLINQLNRGTALISDSNEKSRVAELNLLAARKARGSTAYAAACTYTSVGMSLLSDEDRDSAYELAFALRVLRAECEFLRGNFEAAETLVSQLLKKANSTANRATAYRLRIDLHIMKSEHTKAVDSALECLHVLGIQLSSRPVWERVKTEYEAVWRNLGQRSIESLVDLPSMTDPAMQAAMGVLSVLHSSAFSVDINLFYLCICLSVNLSLKYGTTDASAHSYAYFGFILGAAFHRYADGYRFAKLGVDLVERHGFVPYKAKVYMTMAWAAIWTQPVSTALDFVQAAFRAAIESGDLTYACYCCDWTVTDLLARGDRLDDVWRESEKALDFVRRAKSRGYVNRVLSQQQFIQSLQGRRSTFSTLSNTYFDEATFVSQLGADDRTILCWYRILNLQARYIMGDYEAAIAAAEQANGVLSAAIGCIQLLDYHYYTALAIAAVFDTSPSDRHTEWREALNEHLERLKEWGESYPPTFLDKYSLVSAEVARIDGRDLDAIHLYEQAIRCARMNGFTHNEALANEAAGRFFLRRSWETIGRAYLCNARSCYMRWGAFAKLEQLDRLYPGLEEQATPDASATTGLSIQGLDLTTVVKALRKVSREIDLEKLIEALMVSALEHAGATQGLLFLTRASECQVVAEATTSGDRVQVRLDRSLAGLSAYPERVLRSVVRTLENVILNDTSSVNQFSEDEYLQLNCPLSILCLPLLKQRELIGVLYLENNLTSGVFTRDRLAILELIASQAAISLKNAQLHSDLQDENRERKKAEDELRQSAHALSQLQDEMRLASRAAMMGELTASLAHELNQPLGGILSNAQAMRRLLAVTNPDLSEIDSAIEDIISDNSRAIEIIRNVRGLFERGDTRMERTDLKQVLLDAERILAPDAARRSVLLRLSLPASLPKMLGNRTQLLQALMNLAVNAFDAVCEKGAGPREVEIACKSEDGRVHIAVRDTGKGIDREIVPRLFDAFFTTKSGGMGMGLAIVRSIVENHGGRILITRNCSDGATMEVELPVEAELAITN